MVMSKKVIGRSEAMLLVVGARYSINCENKVELDDLYMWQ
jgi:hypothetical protein